jgi:hypothetical protein
MGSLLLFDGAAPRVVPLSPVTLVGRGSACHGRVAHPWVPLHWLEVRWLGDVWGWRALGAEDLTRGPSTYLAAGWRSLGGPGRYARVTLGDRAWVELTDPSPPSPFAWDLVRDALVDPALFERLFEERTGSILRILPDGEKAEPLQDGTVVACVDHERGPVAVRVHVPVLPMTTADTSLDLLAADVSVEVDLAQLHATFHLGHARAVARGECVRVLWIYLRARHDDAPQDGWMSPQQAWDAWIAAGGNRGSPRDRLGWERGKLRSQLARLHVANVDALFEITREGDTIRTRLGPTLREL